MLLLLLATVAQHGIHDVHLRVASRSVAAARLDILHNDGGRGEIQARTAISLRNERRQEARLGQALAKSGRIFRLAVEVAPIFAGKVGAERTNREAEPRVGKEGVSPCK